MPPYSDGSMRSAYHVRELEAYRLAQVHALCLAAMLLWCPSGTVLYCALPALSVTSLGQQGARPGRLHCVKL